MAIPEQYRALNEPSSQRSPLVDFSPKEYGSFLREVNELNIQALQIDFRRTPLPREGMSIVVVGSDGKLERHAQSKTEVIVIRDADVHDARVENIIPAYDRIHKFRPFAEFFDVRSYGTPEVKLMGADIPLSYVGGSMEGGKKATYPDKLLNAIFLFGDPDLFMRARTRVAEEMGGTSSASVEIRDEMHRQLNHHQNTIQTGMYRNLPVFSREFGVQIYNEGDSPKEYQYGFKIAFIRAVQRTLDLVTARAIARGKITAEEVAKTFPVNTGDRIHHLDKLGLLPEVEGIVDAYFWFLQQYHRVQEQYKQTHRRVILPYDTGQFSQHAETIGLFLKGRK